MVDNFLAFDKVSFHTNEIVNLNTVIVIFFKKKLICIVYSSVNILYLINYTRKYNICEISLDFSTYLVLYRYRFSRLSNFPNVENNNMINIVKILTIYNSSCIIDKLTSLRKFKKNIIKNLLNFYNNNLYENLYKLRCKNIINMEINHQSLLCRYDKVIMNLFMIRLKIIKKWKLINILYTVNST